MGLLLKTLLDMSLKALAASRPVVAAAGSLAMKPVVWARAFNRLAKPSAKMATWIVKHPYLASAIGTVAMYTPEIAEEVENYWFKATGGKVSDVESAIRYADQSPEKAALILSAFAASGLEPEIYMNDPEKVVPADQAIALKRNLTRLLPASDLGYMKEERVIGSGSTRSHAVDGETTVHLRDFRMLDDLADGLGVRGRSALTNLHGSLGRFMNMSETDLNELITLREAAR